MPWARGGWKRKKAATTPRTVAPRPLSRFEGSRVTCARRGASLIGGLTVAIRFLTSGRLSLHARAGLSGGPSPGDLRQTVSRSLLQAARTVKPGMGSRPSPQHGAEEGQIGPLALLPDHP